MRSNFVDPEMLIKIYMHLYNDEHDWLPGNNTMNVYTRLSTDTQSRILINATTEDIENAKKELEEAT